MFDCLGTARSAMFHDTGEHSRVPVAARTPFFAAKVPFRALFSMLARWQTGYIDIQNQEFLSLVVVPYGVTFT